MRRRIRSRRPDHELIELLKDEPELLAIADAVRSTAPAATRRRRTATLAVAGLVAVIAAAVTLVMLSPWGESFDLVDEALAAVGKRDVVHVVVESRLPGAVLVDRETGATQPVIIETELTYDARQHALRTTVSENGTVISDTVEQITSTAGAGAGGLSPLEPFLAALAIDYRDALSNGRVAAAGKTAQGDYIVTATLENGVSERLILDRKSYLPVAVTAKEGAGLSGRITTFETTNEADLTVAEPAPAPASGVTRTPQPIRARDASTVLGSQALWLSPTFAGLRLEAVSREELIARYPRGSGRDPERSVGVSFVYGDADGLNPDRKGTFVSLDEATSPQPAYGLPGTAADTVPPPGQARLEGRPGPGIELWSAFLVQDGTYVTITASSRELAVGAATALRLVSS